MGRLSRCYILAAGLLLGCNGDPRPPETPGAPELVSYAVAQPAELSRIVKAFDDGRSEAMQRCSEAVELVDAIKDPIDTAAWYEVVRAAERSGKTRLFADRKRENAAFARVLHENDDEIARRTAGAIQFTATQRGCAAPGEVAGATTGALRLASEKRSDERARSANEATPLLQAKREGFGKPNQASLVKQADAIAHATFLVELELPALAYERERLAAELPKVKKTLERALEAERESQALPGASEADRKASDERTRSMKAAVELVDALAPKAESWKTDAPKELRETKDGCREILDALHKAIQKRDVK
jgi:hypothetical protein